MKLLLKKLRHQLDESGLLLLSDAMLPSIVSIIAGKPIKGSWWGHPKGNVIYNISNELADQPDVLTLKLINKKVTFLNKQFWNDLFTIGLAKKEWQFLKLSSEEIGIFELVQKYGKLRADDARLQSSAGAIGKIAGKLETRLLFYSESIHTESGKHIRLLMSWKFLIKQRKFKYKKVPYQEAVTRLEKLANNLSLSYKAPAKLPWL